MFGTSTSTSICGACVCLSLLAPATARGDDKPLAPNRDEFVPVPDIGGNSDIGVELGVSASWVRFREGYAPYLFRLDGIVSTSVKDDARGFRFVQQYHTVRLDAPQFLSPRLRLDVRLEFLRAVDATWFGVGNASTPDPRPAPPDAASPNEYVSEHPRFIGLARIKTGVPLLDAAVMMNARYEMPDAYAGSRLADDLASGTVVGGQTAFLGTAGAGIMIDSRDDEVMPRRGIFYQFGVAGTFGTAEQVRFGEASASMMHFASLAPWLIFANRIVGSFEFGTVPFYELQRGNIFDEEYLVGGNAGIRGVRLGRYAGLVKTILNTELRILPLPRFRFLWWRMLAGTELFFDTGRVWSGYSYRPDLDGRKLGLKYGTGAGLFFLWDQANLFRIDVAYSPDDSGRGSPVSFYFESLFLF